MTFGSNSFTFLHIAISLIGLASGFVVIGLFLGNVRSEVSTLIFLVTTVLTNGTGLMFPSARIMPSHIVAIISLVVLALAIYAYYNRRLAGSWRSIYVVCCTAALYFNSFVLIAQTFQKFPALTALAPTQSELPFVVAQAGTLAAFLVLGCFAVARFRATPR